MLPRRALPAAHFDRNAAIPVTDLVHSETESDVRFLWEARPPCRPIFLLVSPSSGNGRSPRPPTVWLGKARMEMEPANVRNGTRANSFGRPVSLASRAPDASCRR